MYGQLRQGQSIDKIVAIVGKEIIMKSDIDGRMIMMMQQNPSVSLNDDELRKEILNSLIDEKLILTKAKEDSIEVSQDEIDSRWDMFIQTELQRFGSEKRIENVYGKSLPRIKSELVDEIKNQLLSYKITQTKFSSVSVNKREVEEFYEDFKDSLKSIPGKYELYHIVKEVDAESGQKNSALELAEKVRDSLVNQNGDFAEFAKRHSDDTYTAVDGGTLGWFEKNKLFEEFVNAASTMSKGEISKPVETPLGYHIIQLIDKDDNRINTNHILFKVGQSNEDRERVKEKLMEIKAKVESGEDFEELAKEYSDDKETKGFGGYLGKIGEDEMAPELKTIVKDLTVGGVSDPILYQNDPVSPSFRIIYKKEFIPPHIPNLEQDYEEIQQRAMAMKRINKVQDWVKELREELYWEIK
jgi:peptidyl-prolyl cis-trans isomerase SurA